MAPTRVEQPEDTLSSSDAPKLVDVSKKLASLRSNAQLPAKAASKRGQAFRLPAPVVIEGLATGVPSQSKKQPEAARDVINLLGLKDDQAERISRLYTKTCIDTRHMVVDPLSPDFERDLTIRRRMDQFLEHAPALAMDVCRRALDDAQVTNPHDEIGMLVLVTSTGIIAPGVDVAVMKGLGLSLSVARVVVNFMGCAAAMNGLRSAADYVRSHPDRKALVCCVELSSVNAVYSGHMNDAVISSLFADGCASMVVTSAEAHERSRGGPGAGVAPGKMLVREQFSQFLDGSLDGITLGINHNGITCDLSPRLPLYIRGGLDGVVAEVLARHGLGKPDVDLWAIHPGGPKIIEESANSLGLDAEVGRTSWEVLAQHGNMLSASLPFVLQRMVAAAEPGRVAAAEPGRGAATGVAFSFAPGITVEGMVFEVSS